MRTSTSGLGYGLRLAVGSGVLLATYREDILGPSLAPLTAWTVRATLAMLHFLRVPAVGEGLVVFLPGGFGYEVYFRCTGYLSGAALALAILAHEAPIWRRLIGIVVGVPMLVALNLVRLTHLFIVGVLWPAQFTLFHDVFWEGMTGLGVLAVWMVWMKWARRLVPSSKARELLVPVVGAATLDGR